MIKGISKNLAALKVQGRQVEKFVQDNSISLSDEVLKLPIENLEEVEARIEANEDGFKLKLVRNKNKKRIV